MKTKILGTGLSGLIGSRIVELLADKYDFENLSLETGTDITDYKTVEERVLESEASIVLHLAAKADVDGCEKDKDQDMTRLEIASLAKPKKILRFGGLKTAWAVNVEGTRNIVEAVKKAGKRIIYISTDFIFEGTKDVYSEEDNPQPINWYGVTKYEGEKIVQDSGIPYLICRLAFPYRANFLPKKDFVRGVLERFKNRQKILAVKDQVITPTFIDDIALGLAILIQNWAKGIYHLVGSQSLSPYDAVLMMADIFGYNKNLVELTTADVFFRWRAKRPSFLALKNDKIQQLGIKMATLQEGLKIIKRQMEENL